MAVPCPCLVRYAASLKRELDAIILMELQKENPRPPSGFFTFSCADFYWKQMLEYLQKHIAAVEGSCPDLFAEENKDFRFRKEQEYAHVVTLFYEQRVMSFLNDVLVPMLRIELFYLIMEFQSGRGQIHAHLLAWLRDGEPHNVMHQPVPEGIRSGGVAATQAWDAAIDERDGDPYSGRAPNPDTAAPLTALKKNYPSDLEDESVEPEAVQRRVMAWKSAVLERWMRERNMRATQADDFADDFRDRWPVPEGRAPAPPKGNGESPLSQVPFQFHDATQPLERIIPHASSAQYAAKRHHCIQWYCLRCPRNRSSAEPSYRECSKGGFGPEAPLVGHRMRGPMRATGQTSDGPTEDTSAASAAAGVNQELVEGRALRFDVARQYYVVQVPEKADGNPIYFCNLADARPADPDGEQCLHADCRGCDGTPPMGKPKRKRAVIEVDSRGIPKIELPREHPRRVQGMQICTERWMANGDESIIICEKPPAECCAADLAEVARYVPGYMTKGNRGSAEFSGIFKSNVSNADDDT